MGDPGCRSLQGCNSEIIDVFKFLDPYLYWKQQLRAIAKGVYEKVSQWRAIIEGSVFNMSALQIVCVVCVYLLALGVAYEENPGKCSNTKPKTSSMCVCMLVCVHSWLYWDFPIGEQWFSHWATFPPLNILIESKPGSQKLDLYLKLSTLSHSESAARMVYWLKLKTRNDGENLVNLFNWGKVPQPNSCRIQESRAYWKEHPKNGGGPLTPWPPNLLPVLR